MVMALGSRLYSRSDLLRQNVVKVECKEVVTRLARPCRGLKADCFDNISKCLTSASSC